MAVNLSKFASQTITVEPPVSSPRKTLVLHRIVLMLPRVTPSVNIPQRPDNRGRTRTKLQALLTDADKKRVKRFVSTTEPPPVIKSQLPAPDLIRAALSAIPIPQPKPQPKQFVAPTAATPRPVVAVTLPSDVPVIQMRANPKRSSAIWLPAAGAPPRRTAIPAGESPPAIALDVRGSTLAVLNESPSPSAPPPPLAASDGQVSRADTIGEPATRKTDEAGLRMPGVAVDRSTAAATPPSTISPPKPLAGPPTAPEVKYRLSQLGAAQNSISVPLRPFARIVPAAIDKAFAGRNVYSMVIPMAGMDSYRGDWVMWFGEREPNRPDGRISAPLPRAKKLAAKEPSVAGREAKVRAKLIVGIEGMPASITILFCSDASLQTRVEEDLKLWTFRPAAKNGTPFEAEVMLEYLFRID